MKEYRWDYVVVGTLMWALVPVPFMAMLALIDMMTWTSLLVIFLSTWDFFLMLCLIGFERMNK